MVIACNMMDEAHAAGISIDFLRLSEFMGATAVPTVGTAGNGLREALSAARQAAQDAPPQTSQQSQGAETLQAAHGTALRIGYGPLLDPILETMERRIADSPGINASPYGHCAPRWLALNLLQDDAEAIAALKRADADLAADMAQVCSFVQDELRSIGRDAEGIIADGHSNFVRQVAAACIVKTGDRHRLSHSDKLDRVLAHAVWGAVLSAYLDAGGPTSRIGYPTSDRTSVGGLPAGSQVVVDGAGFLGDGDRVNVVAARPAAAAPAAPAAR